MYTKTVDKDMAKTKQDLKYKQMMATLAFVYSRIDDGQDNTTKFYTFLDKFKNIYHYLIMPILMFSDQIADVIFTMNNQDTRYFNILTFFVIVPLIIGTLNMYYHGFNE